MRAFLRDDSGAGRAWILGGAVLVVLAGIAWWTLAPKPHQRTETPNPAVTVPQDNGASASKLSEPAGPDTTETALPAQAATAPEPEALAPPATPETPGTETPPALADAPQDLEAPTPSENVTSTEPPVFEVVRVDDTGAAVVAGRAEAGETVRILLDGVSVAETSADASGAFVALLSLDPSNDARILTLETVGAEGGTTPSEETALVAPFEAEPPAPVEEVAEAPPPADVTPQVVPEPSSESPDATEEKVARLETPPQVVIAGPEGAVPQSPAAAPSNPTAPDTPNIVIDTISYDADGEVLLVGRAASGSFVRVYLNNRIATTTGVPADGIWRSRVTGIAAGIYTLRADETNATGRVLSRFETPFERVTRPVAIAAAEQVTRAEAEEPGNPLAAAAGIVTVQPGFTLWAIARENYGDGVQYVRVFEANRALIGDPDLIYPGQVFSIPEQ
ncbi:LysM peptidoglycan-binding domain-containing protein [Tropicimonas sp. S265A]|uniref:LysM peptidoglycan-binding domain-containing protein n=1 Tax=Tropicimonas sp. S265A TaxID=3415134 RepID=UPI003C7BE3E7